MIKTHSKFISALMALIVCIGALVGIVLAGPENTAYATSSSDTVLDYVKEGFIKEDDMMCREIVGFFFDKEADYYIKGAGPFTTPDKNIYSDNEDTWAHVASYHDMATDTSMKVGQYVYCDFYTTARTSKESEAMYKQYICQAIDLPGAYINNSPMAASINHSLRLEDETVFQDLATNTLATYYVGAPAVERLAMAVTSTSQYEVYDYVVDVEASRKMGCIVSYYLYRNANGTDIRDLGIKPYSKFDISYFSDVEGHVKLEEHLSLGGFITNYKVDSRAQKVFNDENLLAMVRSTCTSIPTTALTSSFTYGGALGIWLWDTGWEKSHTMTGAFLENPDTYQEDGIMHIATIWTRASTFTPPRPERNDTFYVASRALAGCRLRPIEKDSSNVGSEIYYNDRLILSYTCATTIGSQNYSASDLIKNMEIAVSLGKTVADQSRYASISLDDAIYISNLDEASKDITPSGPGGWMDTGSNSNISSESKPPESNGNNIWGAIGSLSDNDKTGYVPIIIVSIIVVLIVLAIIFWNRIEPGLKVFFGWLWKSIKALGLKIKKLFTKKGGKKE